MSLEFWDAVAPDHHGNCSFRHCSPGVLCNVCPNSLWFRTRLTSRCTSSLTSCNTYYTFITKEIAAAAVRSDFSWMIIPWLREAFPFVFSPYHPVCVLSLYSQHSSWAPDLQSLRFSVWLAKQTAVFLSCIYKFSVPVKTGKQQQAAAHHSEQYSPQMKIHLFWYSN